MAAAKAHTSLQFADDAEFLYRRPAWCVLLRRAASFAEHPHPDFRLLALLPRAAADGTGSDAAVSIAPRGKIVGFFGAIAISLASCWRFVLRNVVASHFPGALRRTDNCLGLRFHFMFDEIRPALFLWGEGRGLGNYQGNGCVLRSARICSRLRAKFRNRIDS